MRYFFSSAITTTSFVLLFAACSGGDDSSANMDEGKDASVSAKDASGAVVDSASPTKGDASALDSSHESTDAETLPDSPVIANDSGPTSIDGGHQTTAKTWTEVYAILGANCTSCHGTKAAGTLDMSSKALAYKNLVGIPAAGPACGSSGETRVVASDADSSLLYQKVSMKTPACGAQMPKGKTPLSTSDQDAIETWINAGALDN